MNLKNSFGSSEKRARLPVSANKNTSESAKVYKVTESSQKHSGENVSSSSEMNSKWSSGMWWFVLFLSLCLASCLPVSLRSCERHLVLQLSWLHGQNLNLAANQKSKQYFWEHCSRVSDALYIFNFDILSHIITFERLFGFTLYISLVNSIICDEISESNHLRVSAICTNYKSLKKKKMNIFWSVPMRKETSPC